MWTVGFVVGFIVGFNLGVIVVGMFWNWVARKDSTK